MCDELGKRSGRLSTRERERRTIYRWFSLVTNFIHGFLAYLQADTPSVSRNQRKEGSLLKLKKKGPNGNAPAEDVVEFGREVNVVLFEVGVQVVRAENFRNLDQLILCESPSISALRRKRKKERERSVTVRVTVEEGFFAEDHARKHAPERPHVERVVVL